VKAIVQDRYGTADVLELRDVDRPVARDNEVLLRVHAAGVGPDVWHLMTGTPYMIRAAMGLRRPRNPVLGWDGAGVIEAVGTKVTDLKPGDEVFGSCLGSFAEYARAKAAKLAPKPPGMTFEQAAATPVSGVTALQALRDKARVKSGQRVLVVGASGGVGTFAVQLATDYGAEVTAVCGATAAELVRTLGAADVIDYAREEVSARERRYDAILDCAGGRPLNLLRSILSPGGILVMVGDETGGRMTGMGRAVRAQLMSPFLRQRMGNFVAKVRRPDLVALGELIEKGTVRPVIDSTYPLAEAPDAIRHLSGGHPRGKIVVTV
jgi:NADPH:quinone reductase-like Zn-dependent oxidoreductase